MYEQGIVIALLLWLYTTVVMIIKKNSLMEKNLNRIGKTISIAGTGIKDIKYPKDSIGKSVAKHTLMASIGLFLTLFSWGYVLLVGGTLIYTFMKDIGVPQSIKEWRWKLKNLDMTFDELIKEILKQEGLAESEFPRVRQEWIDYINGLKARE